jgi:hypothetical protein
MIIRWTCASSTRGSRSRPAIGEVQLTHQSGMLLQRKNERREASSRSVTRCAAPAGRLAESLSERKTNAGLARIRERPARIPALKSPPSLASVVIEIHRGFMSDSVTGRRNARRATPDRISAAQGASFAADVGLQVKRRFLAGVSLMPVTLYGLRCSRSQPRDAEGLCASRLSRRTGCHMFCS